MTLEKREEILKNAEQFLEYLKGFQENGESWEDIEAARFLQEDLPDMDLADWLPLINSYVQELIGRLLESNVCPSCGDTVAIQEEVTHHPYGETEVPEIIRYYQCESCRGIF